jgi:hypothetical protein
MPGVFAAGDVRQGSIKRVASAVGEGATVVRMVHDYLREVEQSSFWNQWSANGSSLNGSTSTQPADR